MCCAGHGQRQRPKNSILMMFHPVSSENLRKEVLTTHLYHDISLKLSSDVGTDENARQNDIYRYDVRNKCARCQVKLAASAPDRT